jgi:polynucleotide 5'-hydroxyl-kinase GRC3/NOL9
VNAIKDNQENIEQIIQDPGVILLLGRSDSGKTTKCIQLVNAALKMGHRVAVVDTDVGQSEIGPPTAISFGMAYHPIKRLNEILPDRLYFVGVTSPAHRLARVVDGSIRMVQLAKDAGASLIIVDTSGMVAGNLGHVLKLKKIDRIKPDRIVALQSKQELEPILSHVNQMDIRIYRSPIHPETRSKSVRYRSLKRKKQFADYFNKAVLKQLNSAKIKLQGFPVSKDESHLKHLIVGLEDRYGDTLEIGLIHSFNRSSSIIEVWTPVSDLSSVTTLRLGAIKLLKDGTELETIS